MSKDNGFKGVVKDVKKNWVLVTGVLVLLVLMISMGGNLFSIVGNSDVEKGKLYSANISLSSPLSVDSDYTDGFVRELYGGTAIIKSNGTYEFTSPQSKLTGSSYSYTLNWTPTVDGNYAVVAFIVDSNNSYNYTTHVWGGWTSPHISVQDTKLVQVYTVGQPTPNIIDIFLAMLANIWNMIKSWFGF